MKNGLIIEKDGSHLDREFFQIGRPYMLFDKKTSTNTYLLLQSIENNYTLHFVYIADGVVLDRAFTIPDMLSFRNEHLELYTMDTIMFPGLNGQ